MTDAGQAALANLKGPFGEINGAIDSLLDEPELETLARALDKLTEKFGGE